MQRGHKAIFDELQSWWSYREGRALQQSEAFAIVLDIALRAKDPRLAGFSSRAAAFPEDP